MKVLSPLPEEIVGDITMALAPADIENRQSLVKLEFDDPGRSRL